MRDPSLAQLTLIREAASLGMGEWAPSTSDGVLLRGPCHWQYGPDWEPYLERLLAGDAEWFVEASPGVWLRVPAAEAAARPDPRRLLADPFSLDAFFRRAELAFDEL